jgi:hypothetical protein
MKESKLEPIIRVSLLISSFICIGGPILLATQKRAGMSIIAALFAMFFWHIVSPRPYRIMLHFLMWQTVMMSNTSVIVGILISVLLRGKVHL